MASILRLIKLSHFVAAAKEPYTIAQAAVPFPLTWRHMTTSKRVKDRSKRKRIHHLEIATEKWKIFSKIHFLMELLKSEPEHIMRIGSLDKYRHQLNLPKPHRLSDFFRKSPELFEMYKDPRGSFWVGLTEKAEELCEEEEREIEANSDKAAEYVTRLLMMSLDGRLRVDKIAHFRRDMGLPMNFRESWVDRYPNLFRVVKCDHSETEYLELVGWKREWAVTELEKTINIDGDGDVVDDDEESHSNRCKMLSLGFPMKFPPNYKRVSQYMDKIEAFQKRSYLSPYADARGLMAGSKEFDKRAVAIIHEMLSFTMEKRLVTDHLTHFREEFVMPQKLMRYLLKHIGIFYVSERGKRFHVFLNEAYEGSELVTKCPLVRWKDKVLSLTGYREKKIKKRMKNDDGKGYQELSDSSDGEGLENEGNDIDPEDSEIDSDSEEEVLF